MSILGIFSIYMNMAVLKIDDNNMIKSYEPAVGIPYGIIFRYWSVDSLA